MAEQLGIVQVPCPEQHAWGGVLKRTLLAVYGLRYRSRVLFAPRRPLLALFRLRTRLIYRRLAGQTVAEVADYLDSGFDVTAIVGVDGSASSGVAMSPALGRRWSAWRSGPATFGPAVLNQTISLPNYRTLRHGRINT
jgi:hypothetical protein